MSPSPRASLTTLGLAVLALGGCFGGEPDPVRDRDATLRLELDEYRIRPGVIKVRPGRVELVAHNRGRLTHNVKIESEPSGEAEPVVVFGGTATAHPGETVEASVPLSPGRYRLTCTIANHDNLGQYGTLIVEPYR
jgi:hypothetical protein